MLIPPLFVVLFHLSDEDILLFEVIHKSVLFVNCKSTKKAWNIKDFYSQKLDNFHIYKNKVLSLEKIYLPLQSSQFIKGKYD